MGDARPWEIMAITFTNKAADEMRRRVVDLVGSDAQQMWVSTFHSACLRMLRAHADVLGYQRGFTIYDAGDAETRRRAHHEGTQPRHQATLAAQCRRRDLGREERDALARPPTPTPGPVTTRTTSASPRSTSSTRSGSC